MANELDDSSFSAGGEWAQSIPFLNWITGPLARGEQNKEIFKILNNQRDEYDQLKGPQFSTEKYTPEKWNAAQEGTPESAVATQIDLPGGTRDAQLAALRALQDQGNGYGAAQANSARAQAMMDANQMARSREGAAMQNAQSRGVGGSGLAYALVQQGTQGAANRAQQGGLQAAQMQALQQLQSTGMYNQGLNDLRGQDTNLAAQNANIANQFNMANTNARNQAMQRNVSYQNQAGQYNAGTGNQAQQYNLNRGDNNAMRTAGFGLNKLNSKANVTKQLTDQMSGAAQKQTQNGNQTAGQILKTAQSLYGMGGSGGGDAAGGGVGDVEQMWA